MANIGMGSATWWERVPTECVPTIHGRMRSAPMHKVSHKVTRCMPKRPAVTMPCAGHYHRTHRGRPPCTRIASARCVRTSMSTHRDVRCTGRRSPSQRELQQIKRANQRDEDQDHRQDSAQCRAIHRDADPPQDPERRRVVVTASSTSIATANRCPKSRAGANLPSNTPEWDRAQRHFHSAYQSAGRRDHPKSLQEQNSACAPGGRTHPERNESQPHHVDGGCAGRDNRSSSPTSARRTNACAILASSGAVGHHVFDMFIEQALHCLCVRLFSNAPGRGRLMSDA